MWAAHEVRARVVEVTPRGRRPRPPAGRHDHAPADQHLAGPPRRPARPARRRDRRRPAYDAGLHRLQPRLAPRRPVHDHAARQPRPAGRAERLALPRRAGASPATLVHLSQAEGDFVLPRPRCPSTSLLISGGSGITPVMSMLRSLQRRTHRGRVTFVHYAQSPDHQIFARRARRRSAAPATASTSTCSTPSSATRPVTPMWLERLVPGFRDVPDLGCAGPAPLIEAVRGGVRRLRRAARRVLQAAARPRRATPSGDGRASPAPASTAANTGAPLLEQAEAARAAPGVRLPDGHLLLLRLHQDRGDGPQRPHRRGVLPARRGHPDLRVRPRRRLRPSTSDRSREGSHHDHHTLTPEQLERVRRRARRHPAAHRRRPRRGGRGVHPQRREARSAQLRGRRPRAVLPAAGVAAGRRLACASRRSSTTWRSATTSCTASTTGWATRA